MISTVSLSFDLTYTDPVTGALQPRGIVTDSTDYAGLGINLASSFAKGLGQITFNGDIIVPFGDNTNPNINLETWNYVTQGVPNFTFNLPLDVNGNVANGVYTLQYKLRLVGFCDFISVTLPDTAISDSSQYADFLIPGNQLIMDPSGDTVQIVSVGPVVGGEFELTLSGLLNNTDTSSTFDETNLQLDAVYTYSGCVQSAAKVNFTYDCEYGTNGTFAVSNATELNGQTIASLNATINYPSWTSTTPTFNSQIVTTTLPYSNNVLATGTFSVSLSEVIQKTQNDGLILQYVASSVQEFNVSCVGSLCNLIPCIESLRNAHAIELQRNRISKYQVFVDNVLMYYAEAQNYRSCGDLEAYRNTLALLESQLDASGCECGCCDPDTYVWVNNNATSTIDSLINAIQFRLFDGTPGPTNDSTEGVEVGALWEDISTLPGTRGILYVCVDNSPGAAIWQVYYDPNEAPPGYDAADITYAGGGVYPSNINVKDALDDTSLILTGQGLSIGNLTSQLALTQAAVAGKLDIPSPQIVGGTKTKVTYDNNGLIVAGTTLSPTDIPAGVLATKIGTGIVDNTEFGYLNGVTSNIQTQLNGKFPLNLTANTTLDQSNFRLTINAGTNQTDIVKNQGGSSAAAALTVQARNAAAANGFGSSIVLSGNITGNNVQNTMSTLSSYWTNAGSGDSTFTLSTAKSTVESVKLTINSDGQLKLNQYNAANFPDPAPAYLLGVNSSGEVVQSPAVSAGPKVYVARILGSFLGGVSLSQIENTTGATFSVSALLAGYYQITCSNSSLFNNTNAVAFLTLNSGTLGISGIFISTSTAALDIETYNLSGSSSDLINLAMIKIEIY